MSRKILKESRCKILFLLFFRQNYYLETLAFIILFIIMKIASFIHATCEKLSRVLRELFTPVAIRFLGCCEILSLKSAWRNLFFPVKASLSSRKSWNVDRSVGVNTKKQRIQNVINKANSTFGILCCFYDILQYVYIDVNILNCNLQGEFLPYIRNSSQEI